MNVKMVTLADLTCGEKKIIQAFEGGNEFQQRVTSMGLYIGCEVEVVGGSAGGGILVAANESRIALGCGMAKKVILA